MSQLRSSGGGGGCFLLVFAVVWTGFSLFWMFGAWMSGAPWYFVLFGLPFVAIGVGLLIWAFLPTLVRMKVEVPQIDISPAEVRVGDRFSFTLRQSFKKAAEVNGIRFEFIFRETATYTQGTDTHTVTHEDSLREFNYPARRFEEGSTFQESGTLEIPEDGMHTFIASDNKLQWFLKLHVDIAGWPDFKEDYEIRVLPELRR